ncbi:MAG: glycosyltransferase [Gemmatales bacterium]
MNSLIIPSYNPGTGLRQTWHAVSQFITRERESWEVLFVCDGSRDGSVEQLHRWCEEDRADWCKVLSYAPNQGKGHAVKAGLLAASGEVRVFTDVDLAYSFEELQSVVAAVRQGAPVAIASREHPESFALLPMSMVHHVSLRRVQSHVFRGIARMIVGLPHADTQAGLKAFSAQAVEQVMPLVACKGFGFDCEVLLACKRLGLDVRETPVTVRYQTAASTTSWKTSFQMIKQIWQIRGRWKRGTPAAVPLPVELQCYQWTKTERPLAKAA